MNGMLGYVYGLKVVVSNLLPLFKDVQYRFPKTKRKRVTKKWSKDFRNYKQVENNDVYQMGDTLICNSRVAEVLRNSDKIAGRK